ncbi:MAG TPA: protein translocase subunit SecF [Acidimicrobiales bacterium]|nr:protein translocase subunit SecF [Acidimicrobiales bacterium]
MTVTDDAPSAIAAPHGRPNAFVRLYRGETSFDFVGRRRQWYLISGVVIVAGILSMSTKGFNFGIDFKGGQSWEVPALSANSTTVQNAVQAAGVSSPIIEFLGTGSDRKVQVEADLNKLSSTDKLKVERAVSVALGRISNTPAASVTFSDVGPTWGSQITDKAILAVLVFFVVVVGYITLRFEWKMAIAALVAVVHDLLVTAGIYSLTGFQVTPDTVVAILTILGYSLYDTVVVFDRVGENTKGFGASGRMTYEDVVNLSMNQTLARSMNTSLVAILPVLAVLVIGAQILGATTLQYFGLALVIGLTSGAYSSIFIASPILAVMKEREPRYQNIRQKLANRADRAGLLTPRAAALSTASSTSTARATGRGGRGPASKRQGEVLRPGSAARARTASGPAPATPDAVAVDDEDIDSSNGAARPGGAAAKRPAGASGARRPPPRPRKGKGKGKGGKRR